MSQLLVAMDKIFQEMLLGFSFKKTFSYSINLDLQLSCIRFLFIIHRKKPQIYLCFRSQFLVERGIVGYSSVFQKIGLTFICKFSSTTVDVCNVITMLHCFQ